MRLSPFLDTQLLDFIRWSEPEPGTLAYRYPMLDMEIQTGARLTVRDGEMAVFVDEGRIADVFGPGLHTLNAATLPVLSGLKRWEQGFAAAFKSDVYFFSTRPEIEQKWGTSTPIALSDTAIHLRGYGVYSYRIADVRTFFGRVSGTRESYFVYDLDDRLRSAIVARMADVLAASEVSYVDLTANAAALSDALVKQIKPAFAALGLELTEFTIQSVNDSARSAESTQDCDCCGARMRADHGALKCDYCHNVVVADAGDDAVDASAAFAGHACPACEIPLMQATIGGASLLYCTRCDGMLVAMEEFDALVAASRALSGRPVATQAAKRGHSVACPECRHAMEARRYGGDVAIDSCDRCGWSWLDHAELAQIAHAPVSEFGRQAGAYFSPAHADASVGVNLSA